MTPPIIMNRRALRRWKIRQLKKAAANQPKKDCNTLLQKSPSTL